MDKAPGGPMFIPHEMRYLVWQYEICPDTERIHVQGYVEWIRSKNLRQVKTRLGQRAHCEARKGTREQARDYCKKDESRAVDHNDEPMGPYEFGKFEHEQGKRNDLIAALNACVDIHDFMENYPEIYCRYRNGLRDIYDYKAPVRIAPPNVVWIWGRTGIGKDRYANEQAPNAYIKTCSKWWNGFDGQQDVIISDFSEEWKSHGWTVSFVLNLFDRYRVQVEPKGGAINMASRNIFITSHFHPRYYFDAARWPEVRRRINRIMGESELPKWNDMPPVDEAMVENFLTEVWNNVADEPERG
jgi:hypothetical protein